MYYPTFDIIIRTIINNLNYASTRVQDFFLVDVVAHLNLLCERELLVQTCEMIKDPRFTDFLIIGLPYFLIMFFLFNMVCGWVLMLCAQPSNDEPKSDEPKSDESKLNTELAKSKLNTELDTLSQEISVIRGELTTMIENINLAVALVKAKKVKARRKAAKQRHVQKQRMLSRRSKDLRRKASPTNFVGMDESIDNINKDPNYNPDSEQ